jgi:hypothetical protein
MVLWHLRQKNLTWAVGGARGEEGKGKSLHRTISVILDGLDLNLSPAHFDGMELEMPRRTEEMKLLGSRKGVAGKPEGRALEIASRLR